MFLRVTEKEVRKMTAQVCESLNLEQPLLYYFTYEMGAVWKRILLLGGMLQAFAWRYYYIAISGEQLILQQISITRKPKGDPIAIPFNEITVTSIRKKLLFTLVSLVTPTEKFCFTLVNRIGGWKSSSEQFALFIETFKNCHQNNEKRHQIAAEKERGRLRVLLLLCSSGHQIHSDSM